MRPGDVVRLFTSLGAHLDEWSSLHFFPARLLFATGRLPAGPRLTGLAYRAGEALRTLAPRRLGDYSVIALTKPAAGVHS